MGRMRCVGLWGQFRDEQGVVIYLGRSCVKEVAVVVKELDKIMNSRIETYL